PHAQRPGPPPRNRALSGVGGGGRRSAGGAAQQDRLQQRLPRRRRMGHPMTAFEFATAGRIIYRSGALDEARAIAASMRRRPLVATCANVARAAPLSERLVGADVSHVPFAVPLGPSVPLVQQGIEQAREAGCAMAIGFGGGSAIDAGKAIAALLTNGGDPLDYLEVVGRGQPLTQPAAPMIAIPTTAGTGAEVTRNAVLFVPER